MKPQKLLHKPAIVMIGRFLKCDELQIGCQSFCLCSDFIGFYWDFLYPIDNRVMVYGKYFAMIFLMLIDDSWYHSLTESRKLHVVLGKGKYYEQFKCNSSTFCLYW